MELNTNQPVGGMINTLDELKIKENSWSYALNLSPSTNDKEEYLSFENSNFPIYNIPEGYKIIGHILISDKQIVIFSTNDTYSEIGIQRDNTYTTLINDDVNTDKLLNFNTKYPIKGVFRNVNDENIIYWCDGNNNDRQLNLTYLSDYQNLSNIFLIDKLSLKPLYVYPNVEYKETYSTGGELIEGMYSLSIRYLDEHFNTTDFSIPTIPIPIYKEDVNNYFNIDGGTNEVTTKSLAFQVNNLDTSFKYFQYAVIAYNKGTGVQEIYLSQEKQISSEINQIVTVNRLSTLEVVDTNYLVGTAKWKNSKEMLITDNRLIRANITDEKYDWGKFQIKANDIQTYWDEEYSKGSKQAEYYISKSLMRDEVYALGIMWLFKDGSESPVLHIPGRQKNEFYGNTIPTNTTFNIHNRPNPNDNDYFDDTLSDFRYWDTSHLTLNVPDNFIGDYKNAERWQIYNTAIKDYYEDNNTNILSYYECRNADNEPILYPDNTTCDGERIYPTGAIRHHRMPDNMLSPHFSYNAFETEDESKIKLVLNFENIQYPEEYQNDIIGYKIVVSDRTFNKTVLDKGFIMPTYKNIYQSNTYLSLTNEYLYQGLQFSHDNQCPKSYSIQTSTQFSGNLRFVPQIAFSETLHYDQNNCKDLDARPAMLCTKLAAFHSPLTKFNKINLTGSHIKYEQEHITELTNQRFSNDNFYVVNNRFKVDDNNTNTSNVTLTTNVYQRFNLYHNPYFALTNRKTTTSLYIDSDTNNQDFQSQNYRGAPFVNKTQQELMLLELELPDFEDQYDSPNSYYVADSDCTINSFGSEAIWTEGNKYTRATNYIDNENLSSTARYTNGGSMSHYYVSIKQYLPDIYSDLFNIDYLPTNKIFDKNIIDINKHACGDIFITEFTFRQTFCGYVPEANANQTQRIFSRNTNKEGNTNDMYSQDTASTLNPLMNSFFESKLITMIVESEINNEYRNEGNITYNSNSQRNDDAKNTPQSVDFVNVSKYFPKSYYGNKGKDFLTLELNTNSISRIKDNGEWKYYQLFPNYYELNKDYNVINSIRTFKSLNIDNRNCNDNIFGNRIVYSEKSYYQDVKDTFRIYKALNFVDINGSFGEITNVFENQYKLYVNTERAMFMLQPNSQQLQLNGTTVALGTGDYLSIPPYQLGSVNYNYAGNQGRFNNISTEYGKFFVNQEQGVIYKFTDNLEPITNYLSKWMLNNLPSFMNKAVQPYLSKYPLLDCTTHKYGVGVITTMDYLNNRVIFHKKDFKPFVEYVISDGEFISNNILTFNTSTLKWVIKNDGEIYEIPFDDGGYFENKSWTISYNYKYNYWISYHSYQPMYMFHNGNTFFSNDGSNKIYSHTPIDSYGIFYEQQYNKIYEFLGYNGATTKIADSLHTSFRTISENTEDYYTYLRAMLYNSYQNTGIQELLNKNNLYDNYNYSNSEKYIFKADNQMRVSGFKDLSTSKFNLTNDWGNIGSYYYGQQGYVDKVPVNIDYNKNYYELANLKDYYVYARLMFDNPSDSLVKLQFNNMLTNVSYR